MATQPKYPIAALARGALLALTVVPMAPASAQAEAERVTVKNAKYRSLYSK